MSEHLCDFPRVSQPEGACPYCRIAELEQQLSTLEAGSTAMKKAYNEMVDQSQDQILEQQAQLAELREAGNKIISAIRSGLSQDELEAMEEFELLKEQGDV